MKGITAEGLLVSKMMNNWKSRAYGWSTRTFHSIEVGFKGLWTMPLHLMGREARGGPE